MAEALDEARWERASAFLPSRLRPLVTNAVVRPHWIPGRDAFLYRRESRRGTFRTVVVDAEARGATEPAFDHDAMAAVLSKVRGVPVDADRLPISEVVPTESGFRFLAFGHGWRWEDGLLSPDALRPVAPHEVASPDGRLVAFRRGDDLWVRVRGTAEEWALTSDGAPYHSYGKSPDANLVTVTLRREGLELPPAVVWSPDSTRLLTHRLDERRVGVMPIVQHVPEDGSRRPVLHRYRMALTGDAEVPLAEYVVLEVSGGAATWLDAAPSVVGMMSAIEAEEVWWSADSRRVFLLDIGRGSRRIALLEADAATGAVREVLGETADSFADVNLSVTGCANVRVLDRRGEVIWFSQRDGRGHLYRHDLATGALINRVTEGPFVVRDLVHVDEEWPRIFFTAGGLDPEGDPYLRQLCRVNLDGGNFTVLTAAGEDHHVVGPSLRVPRDFAGRRRDPGRGVAPSGRFFVHTHSTLDGLPFSELRDAEGKRLALLETGALDASVEWPWPQPFRVVADDGETPLFGAMWFPTGFDPARRYPVVDVIYPGPQRTQVPKVLLSDSEAELGRTSLPQMIAEIGCVVVQVDGRGTPLREKAFHDLSFGRLDDPGTLADHVATLRQLAARHPFLDLDRVGITGHSGGGYATVRAMLTHPELFKVGVASAGNHDQRGYSFSWCEKFGGPFEVREDGESNYESAANPPLAARLRGKLLLATGDMDDNVHPALTLQLASALIEADKDFELMLLPNRNHATITTDPYYLRRMLGFLARHLGC